MTDPDAVVAPGNDDGTITDTDTGDNVDVEVVPVVEQVGDGNGDIRCRYSDSYTVTDSDVGMHIRVVATYSDGGGPEESVSFASETPVQAFRRAADNDDPMFASTTVGRRIAENSTGNVGGPVTATDANNGDILTYCHHN